MRKLVLTILALTAINATAAFTHEQVTREQIIATRNLTNIAFTHEPVTREQIIATRNLTNIAFTRAAYASEIIMMMYLELERDEFFDYCLEQLMRVVHRARM